jgi:hypothetical protein
MSRTLMEFLRQGMTSARLAPCLLFVAPVCSGPATGFPAGNTDANLKSAVEGETDESRG